MKFQVGKIMFCSECGEKLIAENQKFCHNCGTEVLATSKAT
ncbi:MAG: zinc-ribbon domain-containing protein, partial [Candidatus Lokiarchaeota archaeon]|nr:zinc-ribbon domain-containing protein [Candidatus Lokiarchaeota archaeon]